MARHKNAALSLSSSAPSSSYSIYCYCNSNSTTSHSSLSLDINLISALSHSILEDKMAHDLSETTPPASCWVAQSQCMWEERYEHIQHRPISFRGSLPCLYLPPLTNSANNFARLSFCTKFFCTEWKFAAKAKGGCPALPSFSKTKSRAFEV